MKKISVSHLDRYHKCSLEKCNKKKISYTVSINPTVIKVPSNMYCSQKLKIYVYGWVIVTIIIKYIRNKYNITIYVDAYVNVNTPTELLEFMVTLTSWISRIQFSVYTI